MKGVDTVPLYLGKGVRGANGKTFYTYGYPIPNSLSYDFSNADISIPMTIVEPTSNFNASSLLENSEIPMALYSVSSGLNIRSAVTYNFYWYRKRDNKLVFQHGSTTASPPSGDYWSNFSVCGWIGWLSDVNNGVGSYPMYREIQENGIYYCNVVLSGGHSDNVQMDFVIDGIPAKTVVENVTSSTFDWTVRLSSYFTLYNYIRAGVCSQPFTDGQSDEPSGIISQVYASEYFNVGCAVSGTGTIGGANSAYGFVQAANGQYYNVGTRAASFRPSNWSWWTGKVSGQSFSMSSSEWNNFTSRINAFRNSQGKVSVDFTQAPYGDGQFYDFMFNQALVGIKGGTLGGYYYPPLGGWNPAYPNALPSFRLTGDIIYASYFDNMRDSLNSIAPNISP